jgi:hypothetical protein
MSPDAEFFLESQQSRAVGGLTVATGRTGDPTVELDPENATLRAGGGESGTPGTVTVRNPADSVDAGELSASGGSGALTLREGSGDAIVTLDADTGTDTKVQVADSGTATSTIGNTDQGGRLAIRDGNEDTDVVVGRATESGGRLTLRDDGGDVTCTVDGGDGALLLSGTPEPNPETDTTDPEPDYGGGDLVVQQYSETDSDVHVHATAEQDSAYGVDAGNRPRIFLNGPAATLELGRQELDADREAVNGEVVLRDDQGLALLELRATTEAVSEAVFRADVSGEAKRRGKIQGHSKGLMIYDAGGRKAMLIKPNGEIETRKDVTTNPNL